MSFEKQLNKDREVVFSRRLRPSESMHASQTNLGNPMWSPPTAVAPMYKPQS